MRVVICSLADGNHLIIIHYLTLQSCTMELAQNPVIELHYGNNPEIIKESQRVRKEVFVVEQGIDEDLEVDGKDWECIFVLAKDRDTGLGVGTFRVRQNSRGFKIERFAVLKPYRGLGLGRDMFLFFFKRHHTFGQPYYLHAQLPVVAYYEKLGFNLKDDEIFEEAGIPHKTLWLY
jgi:predicted GNAT family N-acyltransferase